MNDNNIKEFLDHHKQSIADDGFSERLFATLDCLPQPKPVVDRGKILMAIFAFTGFILFALFGGYSELMDTLVSLAPVVDDISLFTPQMALAILFIGCSLFAVGKYALESE
jgi:hypothetical protein